MSVLGLNLVLATVWALVVGEVNLANLGVGFVLAYLVLWAVRPALGPTSYFRKLPRAVAFGGFLAYEILVSNLRVARDVLSPRPRRRPGVVGVPLDARTDAEITVLANLITLTPGTLSLDVAPDRRTLWVHTMFLEDPEALRAEIKNGFERRVLGLLR